MAERPNLDFDRDGLLAVLWSMSCRLQHNPDVLSQKERSYMAQAFRDARTLIKALRADLEEQRELASSGWQNAIAHLKDIKAAIKDGRPSFEWPQTATMLAALGRCLEAGDIENARQQLEALRQKLGPSDPALQGLEWELRDLEVNDPTGSR